MCWLFRRKKKQPKAQGRDFVGALRSVGGFVIGGQRGYVALQGLPRCRVTEEELIEWVRSGEGRDLLSVREWGRLAAADLGGLSEVAGDVVRELGGEVVEPPNKPEKDNPPIPIKNPPSPTGGTFYRPDTSHIKPEAKELFNQGVDRYQAGDLMGAIDLWSQAIEIDPNFAYAYYNRGLAYSNLKRYEEAITDYTSAIEIDPNDASAYYNRGNAYNALKRYEEAIADYTSAIDIDPKYAYAYNNRGKDSGT
ncbi:tetratricopeptide repeat protein [Spirulina major]|uniref:tetratricopeptide repeat protein n=1 Tax=Spirulina major TaxID=270636 RepID=UPI000932DF4E|nr:tetratricopeptide repeat protein [Spirulina major]